MATPFKLRNGMLLLSTEAPGGLYNAAQLKKIAQICDGDAALVKATEDQRLALFVPTAKAPQVAKELKAVGLGIRNYQDGLHQPVNCIGELCSEHAQDALGLSMDLSQELAKITLSSPLKIGINGCARCCIATHTLDISVIGEPSGYRVSLGGKNSQIPEMASFMAEGVPADKLPKMLAEVVAMYQELAAAGESLQDVMERCGTGRFVEALAPYSQDAAAADTDPFALGGGGLEEPETMDPLAETEIGQPDDAGAATAGFDALEAASGGDVSNDASPLGGESELTAGTNDPAFDPFGDDIPLDDGLGDVPMDDIAINPAGGGSLPDDLAPFPEDDLGAFLETGAGTDPFVVDGADELLSADGAGVDTMLEGDDALNASLDAADALPAGMEELEDLPLMSAGDGVSGELEELSFDDEAAPSMATAPMSAQPAAMPVAAVPALRAAPPPTETIGSADDEDLAAAVEVEDDEADAFEAKLEESIADEESHPVAEDENSADRMAAMQLVEAGNHLPSVEAVAANLGVDGSFDNLEIDHDDETLEPELLGAMGDDQADALDESEAAGFSETVPKLVPPVPAAKARGAAPAAIPLRVPPVAGFDFKGIDIGEGGRLMLSFSSGATVVVDPRTMTPGVPRDFTIAGKKIVISQDAAGLTVDIDGVGIFLPTLAA